MHQSELYKKSKSLNDALMGPVALVALLLLAVGMFMGEWKIFLMMIAGIVLGYWLSVLLRNGCGGVYNWLFQAAGWVPVEDKLSRQMPSVFARKLLMVTVKYVYFLTAIFFVLRVVSDFQVMALSFGLMSIMLADYDQTADNFDQTQDLPSLVSILMEYLFLLLTLLVIAIARYFYVVDFCWVLILFSVVFVFTNLRVFVAWRKEYR